MPGIPAANVAARTLHSALAALRIIFFGPPGAGKTGLLRAVANTATKGAEELPVDLVPAEGGAERAFLRLEMRVDRTGAKEEAGEVHFYDCDGRAAARLLEHPEELSRQKARGELQGAIHSADTIVLAVDAGWRDVELRANFCQFKVFLQTLENLREYERETGGLPVFLALTKCDALYRAGESQSEWMRRVTQRQAEVLDAFHDFFDGDVSDPVALEFGSIELDLIATATKPVFGEMLGVEELTRRLLAAAQSHRDRIRRSQRRLTYTLGGLIGLGAAFLGAMLLALLGPPGPLEKLTNDVEAFRAKESPPAVRLADANFRGIRHTLDLFLGSPEYPFLRPELHDYLQTREREFERYREYRQRFQPPQFSPAEVRTAGEFEQLKADLAGVLAPPVEYREAWHETEAVRLHAKWQRDLELLQHAESETHEWYRGLIRRGTELLLADSPGGVWREQLKQLLRDANRLPFASDAAIPQSDVLPIRRGESLTYSAAYRFERTASAQRDWSNTALELRDLLELCEALGVIYSGVNEAIPAPLNIPKYSENPLGMASERLELLKRHYPHAADGSADWSVSHFHDPMRTTLSRILKSNEDNGVNLVRGMIAKELFEDTPSVWAKLEAGLLQKPEFRAWGTLLQKLSMWGGAGSMPVDPVVELSEFLKRERFAWPVEKVELYLPNALREQILSPDGSFTITVTPKKGPPRVTLFRNAKAIKNDPQGTMWQFNASSNEPIVYSSEDGFAAEVSLRAGESRYELKWLDGRSNTYRFDRLRAEPTIIRDESKQRATGVKLTMLPEAAAIRVPVLLPNLPGVK